MKNNIPSKYIILLLLFLVLLFLISLYIGNNHREKHKVIEFQKLVESGTTKELSTFLAANKGINLDKLLNKHTPYWDLFGTIADQNDLEKLKLILQYKLSPNRERESDSFRIVSPLIECLKNPQVILLLLESGAYPNKAYIHYKGLPLYEEFPLYFAIRLLQTGKEKNKSFVFSDPENFFPESVKLSALARHEQFKAEDDAIMKSIELLVQYGADVDKGMLFYADREKKYLMENETPLIIACRIGRLDLIHFLLDSGADTSLRHLEKTALDCCRESNQFDSEKEQQEAIKLLQEKSMNSSVNLSHAE